MKQRWLHIGGWALGLTLALSGCAKDYAPDESDIAREGEGPTTMAIGTLRIQDGVPCIRLDENTCSQVMNPDAVQGIPDHTRVFLGFRYVASSLWDSSYTDAILVDWVSPIDAGSRSMLNFEECFSTELIQAAGYSDPWDIIPDWMTTLEDGFLTLHYQIPMSGKKKHRFELYQSLYDYNQFYLVHRAEGDTDGSLTDGIVSFDVSPYLRSPYLRETGEDTVTLRFAYIDLTHTEKQLTVEYRSPK